ncbi:unnamed protein product, partial [Mesorhabditis spiculigera]
MSVGYILGVRDLPMDEGEPMEDFEMAEAEDEFDQAGMQHGLDEETLQEIKEKKKNGMFVSAWEEDDQDVDAKDLNDPVERYLTAAEEGRMEELQRFLLDDPELLHKVDVDGYTALHRASYNNHLHIVDFLVEKGANLEARTGQGWTPLHSACNWGNYEIVGRLISLKANPNALSEGSLTPLHVALCSQEDPEGVFHAVRYLVQAPGIDLSAVSGAGDKPLDLARRNHAQPESGSRTQSPITPLDLVKKLEMYKEQILDTADIELENFDAAIGDTVEYERKRTELLAQARTLKKDQKQFLSNKTELNMENAVIAGAKLLVDEVRCRRSMTKQLQEKCGIAEEDILYKGIDNSGRESVKMRDLTAGRTSSVVESFVDFKRQVDFKTKVIDGIVAKYGEERPLTRKRTRQSLPAKSRPEDLKTPKRARSTADIDVMNVNRILGKYAQEVASEIKNEFFSSARSRHISPIPLDFSALDDTDSSED